MSKKCVLVFSQYYYPEIASTAQIYTDLCEGLTDRFNVTVICAVPCYSGSIDEEYREHKYFFESRHGVRIIRVPVNAFTKTNKLSRVWHILSFFFGSIGAMRKVTKPDLVLTLSQPPVLGGLLGAFAKIRFRAKMIYNIQDFNPEQTMAVKYSGNKLVLHAMMALDKWSCSMADLVIVVGHDMQRTLVDRFRGRKVPRNTVINNWIDDHEVYPLLTSDPGVYAFRTRYGLAGKFVIMYSGNIGLYYDLVNLIKIIAEFKQYKDVVFAFVGDGAMLGTLKEYASQNGLVNVAFIPYQPKHLLVYSLNAADVHLVTNAKGIKGISVPSKIYGVMATDVPILGILESGSEAWNIIHESNCGVLCEAGDYDSIRTTLAKIIANRSHFVEQHNTGHEYMKRHFTKQRSIQRYADEITDQLKGTPWQASTIQSQGL